MYPVVVVFPGADRPPNPSLATAAARQTLDLATTKPLPVPPALFGRPPPAAAALLERPRGVPCVCKKGVLGQAHSVSVVKGYPGPNPTASPTDTIAFQSLNPFEGRIENPSEPNVNQTIVCESVSHPLKRIDTKREQTANRAEPARTSLSDDRDCRGRKDRRARSRPPKRTPQWANRLRGAGGWAVVVL